jgi:hypothetical protein
MNSDHALQRDGYRGKLRWALAFIERFIPIRKKTSTRFIRVAALSLFILVAPFSLPATAEQLGRDFYMGSVGAAASVPEKGEAPGEPREWELRPCCRITDLNLAPADSTTMGETLCRLSIETALRTVDDALSTQESFLRGNGLSDRHKIIDLTDELRKAKDDLVAQRSAVAADGLRDKAVIMRNIRSADQVVKADLRIQAKLLGSLTSRERSRLRKRLALVRARLEGASTDYRNMVAGVNSSAK